MIFSYPNLYVLCYFFIFFVNQSQILVRYGEIGLKSEYTRRQFTNQLKKNILYACSKEGLDVSIVVKRGRLYVHTTEIVKTITVLKKTFGIVSLSPVWESNSVLLDLKEEIIRLLKTSLKPNTSFALRVRRSGVHEYTSQDVAVQIGQAVCDEFNCSVDLDQPDVEVFIEIRDEKSYVFLEIIKGVGGLPYATQGKICCFAQDSFDILASWYLMKRGCSVQFYITNESLAKQINTFLKKWYIPSSPLFLKENLSKDQKDLRELIKKNQYHAICTGINCLKDKRKIIQKIARFQNNFSLPILSPLISMNELECQRIAKEVGINL